jgi:hypothetical protein
MRIKFFGSFRDLVADAREWGSLIPNIPPLMTIIKYKGQNFIYLTQKNIALKVYPTPKISRKAIF